MDYADWYFRMFGVDYRKVRFVSGGRLIEMNRIDVLPDVVALAVCPVCGVGRSDSWSPCGHDATAIQKCAA